MKMTFKKENDVELKIGDVAQLYCTQNETFIKKSDGMAPLGIVMDIYYDRVTINCGRQIINTKNFDVRHPYPLNANVCINPEGQFSTMVETSKYAESKIPSIGMVIKGPTAQCVELTLIWF